MAPAQDFSIPSDIKLCQTHEYIRADEDDRARVGISHYAAEQLGDVVYIELPELGQVIEAGETFGSIESVKAASDLYMPVTGEIVAVNTQLTSEPELINDDCYGDGWMIEIALSNKDELDSLMPPKHYVKFLEESGDSSYTEGDLDWRILLKDGSFFGLSSVIRLFNGIDIFQYAQTERNTDITSRSQGVPHDG